MGEGLQFIDILVFAAIAIFLVFRLRNTLGRRDGTGGKHGDPFDAFKDQKKPPDTDSTDGEDGNVFRFPAAEDDDTDPAAVGPAPDEQSGLHAVRQADPSFSAEEFLQGARGAFEMILGAFAGGDLKTLKGLLSKDVYGDFSVAIENRDKAGEMMEFTLVGFRATELVEAAMDGSTANVTVKFVTDQVDVLRDADGEVIEGDPNKMITKTDVWTFARETRSNDPNWALVGTDVE